MNRQLLILGLALVDCALPHPTSSTCKEVEIPITVATPRYILNTTVEDNWDAATLTFNLTQRDSWSAIAGSTPEPVESTYTVGATLCGAGGPMLVLTHGIIESKLYWCPTFEGAEKYSFVDAAVAAGYSVLSYDRIGVGSSSKVDALQDAQFQVEVAVLDTLVAYAQKTANASKVVLVGHSYGSYIAAATASQRAVDAVVLTGFSGKFDFFGSFIAGAGFRVARTRDPARWGGLGPDYLTTSDLFAHAYVYFAEPYFERRVAEWSYSVGSEPFAVGELPTLLVGAAGIDWGNITAPVLMLQGKYDVPACGGDCTGQLDDIKAELTGAKVIEAVDDLPAGHNPFLDLVAPQAFEMVSNFLRAQGV